MVTRDVGRGFIGAGYIARTALAPAGHAATVACLEAIADGDPERGRAFGPSGAL